MDALALREYRRRDRREVTGVLARAFSIDPLFDYFARDLLNEHRLMPRIMAAYLSDLGPNGQCWVAADENDHARGFAGWLPPDALPRSTRRESMVTLRAGAAIVRAWRPIAATRLFFEVEKHHPHEPHWYLGILAVDPTRQGRGHGKELITPGLERADRDRLPCYLETQKEQNVPWYARFGFDVREEIRLPGIPPVWCLWRQPA
ncbi:MAG TPA: GNAT family N-acetyltransferase [Mycobacteriales bacterium]